MATDLKPGERVLFRDGTGNKRVGILEGPMDGPPADWLVRAEGGKNTWIRNEAELELAPYPYGEYIPTEGFDVERLPEDEESNPKGAAVVFDNDGLQYVVYIYQLGTYLEPSLSTHFYLLPPHPVPTLSHR